MKNHPSRLRFNFGFMLEAPIGTSRTTELDYPSIQADDLELTPLRGSFQSTRTSEGVYLQGKLLAEMGTTCVRCLEEMQQEVTLELDEMLYYPPEEAPKEALSLDDTGFVDLAPLFRELSILGLPIRPICREDCLGFCMICGQNLNEADCGCEPEDVDPRMAILRQLLDKE